MRKLTRALSMLLVCCMMFTLLPVTAEATQIVNAPNTTPPAVQFDSFFNVDHNASTNDHYTMQGIGVDANGQAFLIMASDTECTEDGKGNTVKDLTWFAVNPTGDKGNQNVPDEQKVYLDNSTNPHTAEEKFYNGQNLTIQLPGNAEPIVLTGEGSQKKAVGYFVVPLGDFDELMNKATQEGKFNLAVDTDQNGWDIENPGVQIAVHLDYAITKDVSKTEIENTGDATETAFTYTIKVENTSYDAAKPETINPPINVDYVYDYVPAGVVIDKVNGNTPVYLDPDTDPDKDPSTRTLIVDNVPFTLYAKADQGIVSKEYTIEAHVDPAFKGGLVRNVAVMGGNSLIEKEDFADTTVNSYFYVHHIYNDGDKESKPGTHYSEERIDRVKFTDDLRSGEKNFNVTVSGGGVGAVSTNTKDADAVEGTYPGLLAGTLYGGTFDTPENNYTTVHHQFLTTGENGIDFSPAANEHYYVWEPTDKYLRPNHIYVYHSNYYTHQDRYHTVAGYPVSVVDRDCYQLFGFIHDENSNVNLSEGTYKEIKAFQNYDSLKSSTLTAKNLGLAGYLGCYTVPNGPNGIFPSDPHVEASVDEKGVPNVGGTPETFLPFWVTMDGVKVTGLRDRTLRYQGLGPVGNEDYRNFYRTSPELGTSLVETYSAPSATPLMVSAMFMDDNLQHPPVSAAPAPDMIGVKYETITAGNSGNVKRLALSADLSNVYFQEGWFMINNEIRVDAETEGDNIVAEFKLNKVDEGELTIVPCWLNEDGEVKEGAELVLMVQKKLVEKAAEDSTDANSIGYLTDDEYVEVVVTEETAETEATEEPTETEEATEEPVETEAVEEPSEELTEKEAKKAEKEAKKAEKKNNKKNNKKDELAETEAIEETAETEAVEETTEAPVEVTYEEITTVTFVRSAVRFAEAYDAQDLGFIGIGLD